MVGKIIGNYQITGELAQGGMGAVFRARHLTLPREVVVKSILPTDAKPELQAHLRARFLREAHIQSQLDHPNIVRVYEFFSTEDNYYLVMEYVPGMSLQGLLARQGALPVADALHLFKQALAALDYAHAFNYVDESGQQHRGVIHRDIKPGNMLIDGQGRLKISDFGIAKLLGSEGLTRAGFNPGTIGYMSPEQLSGYELDARSDLYSLGVTLYEMLAGRLPFVRSASGSDADVRRGHLEFPPPPIRQWRPDLPSAMAAVVMHSLRKDLDQRFQSASEFLAAVMNAEQTVNQSITYAQGSQSVEVPVPVGATLVSQPLPLTPSYSHPSTPLSGTIANSGGSMPNPSFPIPSEPRRKRGFLAFATVLVLLALAAGIVFYLAWQDRLPPEFSINLSNSAQANNTATQSSQPNLNPAANASPMSGVDQSSAGSDPLGAPAQSPVAINQVAGQSIDRQLFTFSLTGCRLSGTIVTCDLLIINRDKDRNMTLQRNTQIFDESGGAYPSRRVEFANQASDSKLVAGVPTSVRMVFEGVPVNARRLSLLELVFSADSYDRAEFRNVPLANSNAPTAAASQSGAPPAMQSVDLQLITFSLNECRMAGSIVTCAITLTNKDRDKQFTLQRSSQLSDGAGNTYACRRTQVANQEYETKLITDVPTAAQLVFEGVSPQARKISKLEIVFTADSYSKVEFRDIPLMSGSGIVR